MNLMDASKKKRWVLCLVLVIFGLLLAYRTQHRFGPSAARPIAEPGGEAGHSTSVLTQVLTQDRQAPTELARTSRAKANTPELSQEELRRGAAEAQNVAIDFWGRIVDQDDAPLSGAAVTAGIRKWGLGVALQIQGGSTRSRAVSGADGSFEIRGGRGDVLTITSMEKEGYEPEASALRSFGYNISTNITADPRQPVTFRMWKQGRNEKLITGNKFFTIIPDGRPYTIDLLNGQIAEGAQEDGDLRVAITRAPDAVFGKRFNWSCKIEPIAGGVLEDPDYSAPMLLAPSGGYATELSIGYEAKSELYRDGADTRFVSYSRTKRIYARTQLIIYPFYHKGPEDQQARLRVHYAINPSGSRVLR